MIWHDFLRICDVTRSIAAWLVTSKSRRDTMLALKRVLNCSWPLICCFLEPVFVRLRDCHSTNNRSLTMRIADWDWSQTLSFKAWDNSKTIGREQLNFEFDGTSVLNCQNGQYVHIWYQTKSAVVSVLKQETSTCRFVWRVWQPKATWNRDVFY